MCNTPTYCDLGKAAKDVFNKGYGFGMVKIDLKTKSCSGVEFSTSGHAYTDTGKASGNLETRYKVCNYGLTFTQKQNTDDTLGTEISWENKSIQWEVLEGMPGNCHVCATFQLSSAELI
uniref:Non-selective voltage-gated ion channel VDAC3 n=1 Tax=Mus spicilegus TaxID=10103 RepID=A0A8C6IAC9_MUSSI